MPMFMVGERKINFLAGELWRRMGSLRAPDDFLKPLMASELAGAGWALRAKFET